MNDTVTLVDVSLRDGLQDEPCFVSTSDKARLVRAIASAGVREIEATSFVHPRWVPQLADADALPALLPPGPRYRVLALNERGFERALAAFDAAARERGSYDVVFVVSASPRHHQANNNRTLAASLDTFDRVAQRAADAGVSLRGAIACAFVSPWPGEPVDSAAVMQIVERFERGGACGVTLADTVGSADPRTVAARFSDVRSATRVPLAAHLHDANGWGLANAYAALGTGVRAFEAALAGLGGCPFAPDAPGNIDLERLTQFMHGCGLSSGIDPGRLADARDDVRAVLASASPLRVAS